MRKFLDRGFPKEHKRHPLIMNATENKLRKEGWKATKGRQGHAISSPSSHFEARKKIALLMEKSHEQETNPAPFDARPDLFGDFI